MAKVTFSKEELERYSRHLIIPEFNIEGQRKLKEARVLVIGTGGLGSPLLLYLTAAGVGSIGIVDFDVVEASNLQRQVLFRDEDIGKPKAEVAVARLRSLNPHVDFQTHNLHLNAENALDLIRNYDVVADGTDNFPTRYLVNDACVILGKPNVYGSIFRFEGQVSVFNYRNENGNIGPNYRDLFPKPPPPGLVPSCAEGGVIGVLPGIIGSLQANEVIKVITGIGVPLSGRLFIYDALAFETRTLNLSKDPDAAPITSLIDYEHFCGTDNSTNDPSIKQISVSELHELKSSGKEEYQIIDVREPYEYDIANLGGSLIPAGQIELSIEKIASNKKVIFLCRSGLRSAAVIDKLQKKYGFENLYNLEGGILVWAEEIDTDMPKY